MSRGGAGGLEVGTVGFRPRAIVVFGVCALLLAGGSSLTAAVLWVRGAPLAELHCARATHVCKHVVPSMFGGADTLTFGFKLLTNSRVRERRAGTEWIVSNGDEDRSLGGATEDAAQIATYRRLAADFEAFLTDPNRPRFDATYPGIGSSPWLTILLAGVGPALIFLALWWSRGWVVDLHFDRAAGTVTIDRQPMYFTGKRHTVLPLSTLQLVIVHVQRLQQIYYFHFNGRKDIEVPFVRIQLRDRSGRLHFEYAMPYNERGKPIADERIAAIRMYFA